MTGKKAVLLGATGLVGRHVLKMLLASDAYREAAAIVRRPLPEDLVRSGGSKLKQIMLPEFSALRADFFEGAEDVFCALGSTIREAGTREQFRKVDLDYAAAGARLAAAAGAKRFLMVSALGANAGSKMFYNRIKGEAEEAVRASGVPMVSLFRPSLLLGKRERIRPLEFAGGLLARPLSFVFRGAWLKYRPIRAEDVAAVMVRVAQMYTPGTHVYENDQIHRMAPFSKMIQERAGGLPG